MKLLVYYSNDQDMFEITPELTGLIEKSIKTTLEFENFNHDVEVSFTFTDNKKIHLINKEYRYVDRPTDVLSFPMYDFYNGEKPDYSYSVELGDIVLSLEKAKEQCEEYGHSFEREVSFLTVHSTLHLLGYDHEKSLADEKEMFGKQDEIMKILNINR